MMSENDNPLPDDVEQETPDWEDAEIPDDETQPDEEVEVDTYG